MREDVIGLEISGRVVKAALVRDGIPLTFKEHTLPPGVVSGGVVRDEELLARELRTFFREADLPTRKVRVGFVSPNLAMRPVSIHDPGDEELVRRAALLVAPSVFEDLAPMPLEFRPERAAASRRPKPTRRRPPFDLEARTLDHVTIRRRDGRRDLVLVSAQRDEVIALERAVMKAGLRPMGIEPVPLAIGRAIEIPHLRTHAAAVIDIGESMTSVTIYDQQVPVFLRVIELGGRDFTRALVSLAGSREEAESLKRRAGIGTGVADPDLDAETSARAKALMLPVLDDLIQQVHQVMRAYGASEGAQDVFEVVLTGGGSRLSGIADVMTSDLDVAAVVAPSGRGPMTHSTELDRHAVAFALSAEPGIDLARRPPRQQAAKPRRSKRAARSIPPVFLRTGLAVIVILAAMIYGARYIQQGAQEARTEADTLVVRLQAERTLDASPRFVAINEAIRPTLLRSTAYAEALNTATKILTRSDDIRVISVRTNVRQGTATFIVTGIPKKITSAISTLSSKGLSAQKREAREGTAIEVRT